MMLEIEVKYIAADYDMDGTWALDYLIDDDGQRAIEVFDSVSAVEQHIEKMKSLYQKQASDDYGNFVHACTITTDNEGRDYITLYNISRQKAMHIEGIENIDIIDGVYQGEDYHYEIY